MTTSATRDRSAVILAAGRGTRMNSDLPKVAHEVAGRPMIRWVIDAVIEAGASRIVLVVGHGEAIVREIVRDDPRHERIAFVRQEPQLGTGHATACAREVLADATGDVFVLAGDGPLIRASTLRRIAERQSQTGAAATLATAEVDDPTGYGRIVRDEEGRFAQIVEQKNLRPGQEAIREINPSYACFDVRLLFDALAALRPDSVTGEYYLTDVPRMLLEGGHRVELVGGVPAEDVLSINTPAQLAEVDAILRARLRAEVTT